MRYQIITTANDNPGDQFIRIGVENILRHVDPDATFVLTDKENNPRIEDADRHVWAGMPMFWESPEGTTQEDIPWWSFLLEFSKLPTAEIWGAGACYGNSIDTIGIARSSEKIECKATARDWVLAKATGWDLAPCPAYRCIAVRGNRSRKLCNFQPNGGHYPDFNPEEATTWRRIESSVISSYRDRGFEFIAHNLEEVALAERFRFQTIHHGNAEHLLSIYKDTDIYFGHRVHGAIAALSGGASLSTCLGVDTRRYAVLPCGGIAVTPSQLIP